jgi:hypothetical protein
VTSILKTAVFALIFSLGFLQPSIASAEQQFEVYLTGYSWFDNTPRGSAAIAKPVIHRQAGGTGTYQDPITLAVGHSKRGGPKMDFPAGTLFYFPRLRKYAIVEDLCGDGPRPENGACHIGKGGRHWVDIYVGGKSSGNAAANNCMNRLTGFQMTIINPSSGYAVLAGELTSSGCQVF